MSDLDEWEGGREEGREGGREERMQGKDGELTCTATSEIHRPVWFHPVFQPDLLFIV